MLIRVIVWPTEARQHLQEPMASPHTLTHPFCPHSHRLWAFTRCHYFIVSLHACDRAVQLTLCCSSQASSRPAHWGLWGYWGGGVCEFGTALSQDRPLCLPIWTPTHSSTPSLCLLLHSITSQCAFVNSHRLLKSVLTYELQVRHRDYFPVFLLDNFYKYFLSQK